MLWATERACNSSPPSVGGRFTEKEVLRISEKQKIEEESTGCRAKSKAIQSNHTNGIT